MKKIRNYSKIKAYIVTLFHPKTIIPLWSYVFTVLKDFFALQFLNKWKITHIPVVNVDHPLDDKIPFVAEKVDVYLDFVNCWIRPLSLLIDMMGVKKAAPYIAKWFRAIRKCYFEAGKMYKFCMSTMKRPPCNDMFYFKLIHTFDPHLLCVPSLHIAVIILTFSFYKDLFENEREFFTDEEIHAYNSELYADAVAIAESVLYVKQHSVNCVPAAMYMMTQLFPELFNPIDAVELINRLFETAADVAEEDKDNIVKHIEFVYERFLLEGQQTEDWKDPVKRWIVNYEDSEKTIG